MTAETLNEQFKATGQKSRGFIRWAESKGVKIFDATVSRQRSGKQEITESFVLAYLWFFECHTKPDETVKL